MNVNLEDVLLSSEWNDYMNSFFIYFLDVNREKGENSWDDGFNRMYNFISDLDL